MATLAESQSVLRKLSPTQEKVDLAVKAAIEIARPSRVFLFGSWPRGEARWDSDLDMAVLIQEDRKGEVGSLHEKISERLHGIPMSIDLIVASEGHVAEFLSSINSIYYKIVHRGKLVYGNAEVQSGPERKSIIDKDAQVLLSRAADDETMARLGGVPDGPFGFHVPQAIEKLLKALLSQLGIVYERTHDLNDLLKQLQDVGEALPQPVVAFSQIEKFAVVQRYGEVPQAVALDRPQALENVRICENTLSPALLPFPPPLNRTSTRANRSLSATITRSPSRPGA